MHTRDDAMIAAYRAGASLHELGRRYGLSHEAVRLVLIRAGVPRRGVGGDRGRSAACYAMRRDERAPWATIGAALDPPLSAEAAALIARAYAKRRGLRWPLPRRR